VTTEFPFAETINYWKTSTSSPDVWVSKTIEVIQKLGGSNIAEGFGSVDGRAAYAVTFEFQGDRFRSAWPVLPTKRPEDFRAARIQAATLMYHDAKAKALAASVMGIRTAFISNLLLPGGKTTAEASNVELLAAVTGPLRLETK
jgi:hypothetical protein